MNIPSLPTAVDPSTHVNVANAYKSCTEIRYNITSADFPAWPEEANQPGFPKWRTIATTQRLKMTQYPPSSDPYVHGSWGNDQKEDIFLSLAINTNSMYERSKIDPMFSVSSPYQQPILQ